MRKFGSRVNLFTLIPVTDALILGIGIWIASTTITACSFVGQGKSSRADLSFSPMLAKNERLLLHTKAELHAGTFMEGELKSHPVYEGFFLLTNERLIFVQYDEGANQYKPLIWTIYRDIWKLKPHNTNLLQYVAVMARDKVKHTYFLPGNLVAKAHGIMVKQIKRAYQSENAGRSTVLAK